MHRGPQSRRAVAAARRTAGRARSRALARLRPRLRGVVEQVARTEVTGVVYAPPAEAPVRVALYLNDLQLTETWAATPRDAERPQRGRGFRFGLRDVWQYAGPGDRLSIRVDGRRLPIVLTGQRSHRPKRAGARTVDELRRQLADGYVFGQSGRLQLPKGSDTAWQDDVLSLNRQVGSVLAAGFGYDSFLIYGSLLGAVREGGFISHDLDFDSAYVSRHSDPAAVLAELDEIARALTAAGFVVQSYASGLKITATAGHTGSIDLYHLYFGLDGLLKFTFGVAGTGSIHRDSWGELRTFRLAGHDVLVPADAQRVVELVYGPGWRTPNPGFNWTRDRVSRDLDAVVPLRQRERIRWNDHYRHRPSDEPTPFASALLARPDLPQTVVDIGCGDGRDTLAFAAAGRRTAGIDTADEGIAHARRRAASLDLDVALDVMDAGDLAALAATVADLRDGPVLFHLRFLLHAVDAAEQDRILRAVSAAAEPGDVLALEFRTTADTSPLTWRKNYRRTVDLAALHDALAASYAFTPFEVREGMGLSPTADQDPYLGRILARRG